MKKIYSTLFLVACAGFMVAQTSVPRTPLYEVFSSSTCPPCKPANDHLSPIFEQKKEDIAVVKYQMSWPGSGDPYFTQEGQGRRGYYGVNGVPSVRNNGQEVSYGSVSATSIDAQLTETSEMEMQLRYKLDPTNQSVHIRTHIETLADFDHGAHKLFIAIVENVTYLNAKTNGETEFHNVFKKMLPNPDGEIIIGTIAEGTLRELDTVYTFQGSYRLPPNAGSPINNEIEHSVEEFEDLHVIMWMQSLQDKSIYNSVRGVKVDNDDDLNAPWHEPTGPPATVTEISTNQKMSVFPNPASDIMNIQLASGMSIQGFEVVDINGRIVLNETFNGGNSAIINVATLPVGIYGVRVHTEDQVFQTKLSVSR